MAHSLSFLFLLSGPDLDECSKNGRKAAEAMSLSKEGESLVVYTTCKIIRLILLDDNLEKTNRSPQNKHGATAA